MNKHYLNFFLLLMGLIIFNSCEKISIEPSPSDSVKSDSVKFSVGVNYVDFSRAEYQDTTKWHYVAVLFNQDRRTEIYLDGIKKVDYYRANVSYNYSRLYLGSSFFTSFNNFYQGSIDELRISNGIRSQNEIQDYYTRSIGIDGITKNAQQNLDNSTIGLWRFEDATTGNTITNSVSGTQIGNLFGTYKFIPGVNGNGIYFDGQTGRADCSFNPPESNMTIEFWFKSSKPKGSIIQPYGLYSSDIQLFTL
jgi:hypothetical protein